MTPDRCPLSTQKRTFGPSNIEMGRIDYGLFREGRGRPSLGAKLTSEPDPPNLGFGWFAAAPAQAGSGWKADIACALNR